MIRTNSADFSVYLPFGRAAETDTDVKLLKFRRLPVGWNYGQGVPIRDNVYATSIDLLHYINVLGLSKTDAFPGTDGDVCLTAYRYSHYLEVVVEVDLSISVSYELEDNEVFSREGLSIVEAKKAVREGIDSIWGSSDLSTLATMIEPRTVSTTWPSKNQQMGVAPQLSAENVLIILAPALASTLERFTQAFPENLRSFGHSKSAIYQTDTA